MNKLLKASLASLALGTAALQGQIEINENLSISGFLDMSVVNTDSDYSGSDTSYNLDQAELDFIFNFDELTGQVDLNYLGDNDTGDFDLEQAFISYDFGEGSSLSAGKFLSYHGWETAEPTGLYQFSYAYDLVGSIPGYHNGVSYNYSSDSMDLGFAVLDSVYGPDASIDDGEFGFELMGKFYPAEGLTLYFGYAKDSYDFRSNDELFNFWASYELGGATYAAEFNTYELGGMEGDQWLVMGNWPVTETVSITARVSDDSIDGGDSSTKYTIAPLWSVSDNLGFVFEVSQSESDFMGDTTSVAFETIFTF